MVHIKSIKINDEEINILNKVIYLYYNESEGYSLLIDAVITEIDAIKYRYGKEAIVLLQFESGQEKVIEMSIEAITEVGNGEIPVIELFTNIKDKEEFSNLEIIDGSASGVIFPNPTIGLSISDVREVGMPNEIVNITATLPIDLAEWISNDENADEILKEALYDYRSKKASK